ncbi:putative deoxyhypusine synthase [archaeon BMS3Abin16]|nr:putative deoxyhypusine synthase [archaeon BMS3Abin16]
MDKVTQIKIDRNSDITDVLSEYSAAGVLGAGDLAKGTSIIEEMIGGESTVFLGLAGPLVASGLRNIIADLIRDDMVQGIVTNGANLVHDLIEAFGGGHYQGAFGSDDASLHDQGLGRIGNVLTKTADFETFETRIQTMLHDMDEELRENISVAELTSEIGKKVDDEKSILKTAYEKNVPIFSPGITDSMLGLQMWMFQQDNTLKLNVLKDMTLLSDMVFNANETGGIFLGGGLPKHYIMGSNLLRGGLDRAVQITLDRPEAGSLSGARLEEGVSWGKVKDTSKKATIIGDATMLFPLMIWAVRKRI